VLFCAPWAYLQSLRIVKRSLLFKFVNARLVDEVSISVIAAIVPLLGCASHTISMREKQSVVVVSVGAK